MPAWSKSMGPNFVPAYQVSGIPYVTGTAGTTNTVGASPHVITFPQVTRFFSITNTGGKALRVGFTQRGVDGVSPIRSGDYNRVHWFEVPAGTMSPRLEIRCKQLWLRAKDNSNPTGFTIIAGMSAVDSDQFPVLTGTLIYSGTDGVGYSDKRGRPTFEGVG